MAQNNETKIAELLEKVSRDPNAAAELLGIAADFLKAREPMPDALADYLANAFKYAASAPKPAERATNLIHGLCLKREEGGLPPIDIPKDDRMAIILAVAATIGLTKTHIPEDLKPLIESMGRNGDDKAKLLYDSRRASLSESELKNFLVNKYEISEGSARNYIKKIKSELEDAGEQLSEIKKSNGLETLIRKR